MKVLDELQRGLRGVVRPEQGLRRAAAFLFVIISITIISSSSCRICLYAYVCCVLLCMYSLLF